MPTVNNKYVVVKIDKAAQNARRTKIGSIYLPPGHIHMQYNLQYGEVMEIGDVCKSYFPEMEVGDTALFHHAIEESSIRLVEKLPNGDEYRILIHRLAEDDYDLSNQLYGIIKPDGSVIPFDNYLFLNNALTPYKKKLSSSTIHIDGDDALWEDEDRIIKIQENLTAQRKSLEMTMKNMTGNVNYAEEIYKEIMKIYDQQESISIATNSTRFSIANILYSNQKAEATGLKQNVSILVDPKILYPLNILGLSFLLIKNEFIEGIVNMD